VPADFVTRVTFESLDNDSDGFAIRNWVKMSVMDDKGLFELYVDFESTTLYVRIVNIGGDDLSQVAIALNKNVIGIGFAAIPAFPPVLTPGQEYELAIPLVFQETRQDNFQSTGVDIAVKTNIGTFFTRAPIPIEALTLTSGALDLDVFQKKFAEMSTGDSVHFPSAVLAEDGLLRSRNVFIAGKRPNMVFASFMVPPGALFLAQIVPEDRGFAVFFKGDAKLLPFVKASAGRLFIGNIGN
jgi:hypothetical protein